MPNSHPQARWFLQDVETRKMFRFEFVKRNGKTQVLNQSMLIQTKRKRDEILWGNMPRVPLNINYIPLSFWYFPQIKPPPNLSLKDLDLGNWK